MIKLSKVDADAPGQLAASQEEMPEMANVGRAYVNSLRDWMTLKERGLPDSARVRTMSPWLARCREIEAEAIDSVFDHEKVIGLFGVFNDLSL